MALKNPCNQVQGDAACADLPDLKRLNYFYGQMLGVNDFRTEQAGVLRDVASLVGARPGSEILVAGKKAPYGHELWLPLMSFFVKE